MTFATGAPGCCCCNNIYVHDISPQMVKVGSFAFGDSRFDSCPEDANVGTKWTLDHYNQKIFLHTVQGPTGDDTNNTSIGMADMTLARSRSDILVDEVIDYGSSFFFETMCTASEDQKLYYVLQDNPATSTYYIYECDFDGSNNGLAFSRTMSSSFAGLLLRIEHCRYDDRLYYLAQKSGDTYRKIYACDRDGSNDALVFDVGSSSPTLGSSRCTFAFDNVRAKLYVVQRVQTSPYSGQILRMDLDGSNQETVYDTGNYVSPYFAYGVAAVRYSHSRDRIYWIEGSNTTDSPDNANDPDAGLYTAGFDGTSAEKLTGRWALDLPNGGSGSPGDFDLGCGYETLGTGTEA